MAEGVQIGMSDGHQGGRAASPGRGPVDHLGPHRSHFLKGSGRLQHGKEYFLAIPFSPHDLDDSPSQEVQGRAGCSLFIDDLAVPVDPFVDDPGEP